MKKFWVMTLVLVIAIFFAGCSKDKNYESAKADVVSFLQSNQEELEEIALQVIENEGAVESPFEEDIYIDYDAQNDLVIFEIDAQGMLGGQYWSLVYAADGTYCGEDSLYIYKEAEGNNHIIAEQIQGCWFFSWMDYDGRKDLLNAVTTEA